MDRLAAGQAQHRGQRGHQGRCGCSPRGTIRALLRLADWGVGIILPPARITCSRTILRGILVCSHSFSLPQDWQCRHQFQTLPRLRTKGAQKYYIFFSFNTFSQSCILAPPAQGILAVIHLVHPLPPSTPLIQDYRSGLHKLCTFAQLRRKKHASSI